MAIIAPELTYPQTRFAHGVVIVQWLNVTENDTCESYEDGGGSDKSIHIVGSFGGGSVSLLGSNDGTNFPILKDLEGNAITASSEIITTVRDNVLYFKPGQPGGTSVSVNIHLLSKAVR